MSANELHIEVLRLRKSRFILRAVNHKLRQQMLHLIHGANQITVTEIYTKMELEQSVASQHLAILRNEKFVNTRRDSKQIFYSVNYERLNEVQVICSALLEPIKK